MDQIDKCGLQPAETIIISSFRFRLRQGIRFWIPLFRQRINPRTARIRQPKHPGRFVKSFPGCIIRRLTQEPVFSVFPNLHQMTVAA